MICVNTHTHTHTICCSISLPNAINFALEFLVGVVVELTISNAFVCIGWYLFIYTSMYGVIYVNVIEKGAFDNGSMENLLKLRLCDTRSNTCARSLTKCTCFHKKFSHPLISLCFLCFS